MLQLVNPEAVIDSDRLRLEPLIAHHAEALYPLMGDPEIYRYQNGLPASSLRQLANKYRSWERRTAPDSSELWLNWAIRLHEGAIVGTTQATIYSGWVAELAYTLPTRYWGFGYATEACHAMIAFLCANYPLSRIIARIDTRNTRSIALVRRLGFVQSDYIKDAELIQGAMTDEVIYSLPFSQPDACGMDDKVKQPDAQAT